MTPPTKKSALDPPPVGDSKFLLGPWHGDSTSSEGFGVGMRISMEVKIPLIPALPFIFCKKGQCKMVVSIHSRRLYCVHLALCLGELRSCNSVAYRGTQPTRFGFRGLLPLIGTNHEYCFFLQVGMTTAQVLVSPVSRDCRELVSTQITYWSYSFAWWMVQCLSYQLGFWISSSTEVLKKYGAMNFLVGQTAAQRCRPVGRGSGARSRALEAVGFSIPCREIDSCGASRMAVCFFELLLRV